MAHREGKVALVAGATQGAGRVIGRMLGERGATVYCSGRSTAGNPSRIGRVETIEETAALVDAAGGFGIAVRTDHLIESEVQALMTRVVQESGRLDILVNDIGGEDEAEWGAIHEMDVERGFTFVDTAVKTHLITSRYVVPQMREQGHGLIVEITDRDHAGYRGSSFYDLAKSQLIRLAYAMAMEPRRKSITVVAITPGFLCSEQMLENFGVSEDNWRDAVDKAAASASQRRHVLLVAASLRWRRTLTCTRKQARYLQAGALPKNTVLTTSMAVALTGSAMSSVRATRCWMLAVLQPVRSVSGWRPSMKWPRPTHAGTNCVSGLRRRWMLQATAFINRTQGFPNRTPEWAIGCPSE